MLWWINLRENWWFRRSWAVYKRYFSSIFLLLLYLWKIMFLFCFIIGLIFFIFIFFILLGVPCKRCGDTCKHSNGTNGVCDFGLKCIRSTIEVNCSKFILQLLNMIYDSLIMTNLKMIYWIRCFILKASYNYECCLKEFHAAGNIPEKFAKECTGICKDPRIFRNDTEVMAKAPTICDSMYIIRDEKCKVHGRYN